MSSNNHSWILGWLGMIALLDGMRRVSMYYDGIRLLAWYAEPMFSIWTGVGWFVEAATFFLYLVHAQKHAQAFHC